MVPFSIELDIKGVVDNIKINMEGLTFEEGLIRLTQMFVFEKQEDIKNRVIGEFKDHPLAHMFGKSLINKDRPCWLCHLWIYKIQRKIHIFWSYICIRMH